MEDAMVSEERYIGLDIHRQYTMAAGVNAQQAVVLSPQKIPNHGFLNWAQQHLSSNDRVALETTSNAWHFYDQIESLVGKAVVANAHKIKLISNSRVKTDKHDALVLAKLLAANLLPEVWVPPAHVRELRGLMTHRQHQIRERTTAKNRLHSVLHRHNINPPEGDPFSEANRVWWEALPLSPVEKLRVRHDLAHIQHLNKFIAETEAEIANQSTCEPWSEHMVFLLQIPGIALNSAMTILAAIGEIERFSAADQLVGYAGLGGSVHASGETYRTGKITKQGRRELRTILTECAWAAARYSNYWRAQYQQLKQRMHKNKAVTVIARKLLVLIWHVLTKRSVDYHADPQAVARSLMKWGTEHRLAARLGLSRLAFVQQELDRLGLRKEVIQLRYGSRVFQVA